MSHFALNGIPRVKGTSWSKAVEETKRSYRKKERRDKGTLCFLSANRRPFFSRVSILFRFPFSTRVLLAVRCTVTRRFSAWRPIFNIGTWCIARRFWTSATCFTYTPSDPLIFRHRMRTDANSVGISPKFRRKVSAINAERFRFRSRPCCFFRAFTFNYYENSLTKNWQHC